MEVEHNSSRKKSAYDWQEKAILKSVLTVFPDFESVSIAGEHA